MTPKQKQNKKSKKTTTTTSTISCFCFRKQSKLKTEIVHIKIIHEKKTKIYVIPLRSRIDYRDMVNSVRRVGVDVKSILVFWLSIGRKRDNVLFRLHE